MKNANGIQDFCDSDELDLEALEAIDEFNEGILTFDELKDLVGPEAAQTIRNRIDPERDPSFFFDDPEKF